MDKESVVASLARNKKIAVETMTGQRYIIERIYIQMMKTYSYFET